MSSKYFDAVFAESDEVFAEDLIKKADSVYKNMISQFGFDNTLASRKIIITVCESIPRYLEVTNRSKDDYKEWMVGNCDHKNGNIAILSSKISVTHSENDLMKVLVHEVIHLVFDDHAKTTDNPIWCAEGVAVLYAEQVEVGYINDFEYPKIADLMDEETFAENGGYDYAGVYVWYFIHRYGFDKFMELYNNSLGASEFIYEGFEKEAICKLKESCLS